MISKEDQINYEKVWNRFPEITCFFSRVFQPKFKEFFERINMGQHSFSYTDLLDILFKYNRAEKLLIKEDSINLDHYLDSLHMRYAMRACCDLLEEINRLREDEGIDMQNLSDEDQNLVMQQRSNTFFELYNKSENDQRLTEEYIELARQQFIDVFKKQKSNLNSVINHFRSLTRGNEENFGKVMKNAIIDASKLFSR